LNQPHFIVISAPYKPVRTNRLRNHASFLAKVEFNRIDIFYYQATTSLPKISHIASDGSIFTNGLHSIDEATATPIMPSGLVLFLSEISKQKRNELTTNISEFTYNDWFSLESGGFHLGTANNPGSLITDEENIYGLSFAVKP